MTSPSLKTYPQNPVCSPDVSPEKSPFTHEIFSKFVERNNIIIK
jgi:hypothetical protein